MDSRLSNLNQTFMKRVLSIRDVFDIICPILDIFQNSIERFFHDRKTYYFRMLIKIVFPNKLY